MRPSVFPPTSTTTASSSISEITPLIIDPSLRFDDDSDSDRSWSNSDELGFVSAV